MAGIYIHIPFCKQACHYCNFHFSTSVKLKNDFITALLREIELQKDYLAGDSIQTIYFGGGTPSLLTAKEIEQILEQLNRFHSIDAAAEITLEANPDDLDLAKIANLKNTSINRLSIGIQSFIEEELKWMHRAHNAKEALNSITAVQDAGFSNLTIDLIYGLPHSTDEQWLSNLELFKKLAIPHLSAYCLTVEPQTALAHFIEKGKMSPMDEAKAQNQMLLLMDFAVTHDYEQYEISNFAQKGFYSKHNSSYWLGEKYLGLGPSAHSFNGTSRQWNVANNALYIKNIQANQLAYESEILSLEDQINEHIMVSLRTSWGLNSHHFISKFGAEIWENLLKMAQPFVESKEILMTQTGKNQELNEQLVLTQKGRLKADYIAAMLFFEGFQ